ncbi:MAG: hypothetical protein ISR77_35565 [Pirellulaceae bacterium]|nr:hypothetical protein [Pirellulaceae bacterium]
MTTSSSHSRVRFSTFLYIFGAAMWASLGCSVNLVERAHAAESGGSELDLKTERVVVFKDGYALILKRGVAVTDENGEIYTNEVPDAAVLGSFWATPKEGRMTALIASRVEEKKAEEKEVSCTETIEILKANLGKTCSVQLPDESLLSGVIQEVLTQETNAPMTDAVRAAYESPLSSRLSSVRPISAQPPSTSSSQSVSTITGTHFVLRTVTGDVLLSANEIRRLTVDEMVTKLTRTVTSTKQTKRLTFHFAEAGKRRELLIAYFRPGLRWIPTYRINLGENTKKEKIADIAMQAELLNEAEDLIETPIDIVVGVPNFRFRSIPSPLILEQTLRNALQQAAPQIMGQFRNDMSNALFSQRAGEFRRNTPQPANQPESTNVQLPAELTTAAAQELFVYSLNKLTLRKGERAAVPVFTTQAPYRNVYTWNVHVKRNDIATAPSGSGVQSPLVLSKNEVWRQIELTNTTDVPWTTGAAMIMQGNQPLAQELLTYTSPKAICRVPVTVAIDIRGNFAEQETGRQLKAMTWNSHYYAKIDQRATIALHNHKPEAVNMEVTLRFGGRADEVSHDGKVTLMPYRADDWERYRGDPAVNNSSTVFWRVALKPDETFQPTVDYHFYTRH